MMVSVHSLIAINDIQNVIKFIQRKKNSKGGTHDNKKVGKQ